MLRGTHACTAAQSASRAEVYAAVSLNDQSLVAAWFKLTCKWCTTCDHHSSPKQNKNTDELQLHDVVSPKTCVERCLVSPLRASLSYMLLVRVSASRRTYVRCPSALGSATIVPSLLTLHMDLHGTYGPAPRARVRPHPAGSCKGRYLSNLSIRMLIRIM
jgi:hypothetical protein